MKIIEMDISEVIPYANNPRNNAAAIDAVAASIREFGFKVPVVIDRNNILITGHTRLSGPLTSRKRRSKHSALRITRSGR